MAYEVIETSPTGDDYMKLSEHQERTPGSFFGGKPVLHMLCPESKIEVSEEDFEKHPDFAALKAPTQAISLNSNKMLWIHDVDVWVTHLMLFNKKCSKGLQIPYPTISIHALDEDAVLLELNLSDEDTPDEDMKYLQLRIDPQSIVEPEGNTDEDHGWGYVPGADRSDERQIRHFLYEAISACQELNPDPAPHGEAGAGADFDETTPGMTGWITSENMADYTDADGNFRMPADATVVDDEKDEAEANHLTNGGGLGSGAGTTRSAAEADLENGVEEATKWHRTD